jgi:thymidylate synthase (FAD)
MNIILPSFTIEDEIDGNTLLKRIERAGRTCYKSENKITNDSSSSFVKMLIEKGHETVLEHEKVTVRVLCDRGVSHEIVRHRIASYSQESTRYCNYSNDKYSKEITVIDPIFWRDPNKSEQYKIWKSAVDACEDSYLKLLDLGATPQEARSVLPNSLKTEIVMTMNLREWRHFFTLRTSSAAHPQMLEIARPMLDEFKKRIPVVFDDIAY